MLKAEGYAGMTTAKVAARSGENKALIAYHFGSKQGLVAAAAREVAEAITEEVLSGLKETDSAEGVIEGVLDGLWRVLDRDERLARLYFDLAAVAVVEPDVRGGHGRDASALATHPGRAPRRARGDHRVRDGRLRRPGPRAPRAGRDAGAAEGPGPVPALGDRRGQSLTVKRRVLLDLSAKRSTAVNFTE